MNDGFYFLVYDVQHANGAFPSNSVYVVTLHMGHVLYLKIFHEIFNFFEIFFTVPTQTSRIFRKMIETIHVLPFSWLKPNRKTTLD